MDNYSSIVEAVVKEVVDKISNDKDQGYLHAVPIGVSNRHVHLSSKDLDILFGHGYELRIKKHLKQHGQYACEETVDIRHDNNTITDVRVLGPVRERTQVEISATDGRRLKLSPPVRSSGDLAGSSSIKIVGPKGTIMLSEGCIIPTRHIHVPTNLANTLGLNHGEEIAVRLGSVKSGILYNVYCKVSDNYAFELHLDTDDANAFQVGSGDLAELIF